MKRPEKNWLEWTVFWASLAVVVGVASYLAHAALTSEDQPPQLAVTLGEAERVPSGYAVPVVVANSGDRTAENVRLEVLFDAASERAELELAFVPQQSTRRGWVTFRARPSPGGLRASVLGYESR